MATPIKWGMASFLIYNYSLFPNKVFPTHFCLFFINNRQKIWLILKIQTNKHNLFSMNTLFCLKNTQSILKKKKKMKKKNFYFSQEKYKLLTPPSSSPSLFQPPSPPILFLTCLNPPMLLSINFYSPCKESYIDVRW